ncbi:hypothetical protein [Psychrobacillus psychrodurans]|uniref:Lipoprotein n=1 Tax=Psychrobacillus psychrodurans TaxID=126157 RepID=A0A9X3RB64_9BACI|nr:hypothetical protein [Psychrobacillus psychrodurans]MCZ8534901.1 hypothetical protein [Psychrobacillus psychrodurans]
MKKRGLLFISIAFIFLLAACSEEVIQYEAKASDFEESGFKNRFYVKCWGEVKFPSP